MVIHIFFSCNVDTHLLMSDDKKKKNSGLTIKIPPTRSRLDIMKLTLLLLKDLQRRSKSPKSKRCYQVSMDAVRRGLKMEHVRETFEEGEEAEEEPPTNQ